jgi:hypothetical protein
MHAMDALQWKLSHGRSAIQQGAAGMLTGTLPIADKTLLCG